MVSKTPGLLAVLSEPGSRVTLDEFQDWYDNEHVPLRMNHFRSFLAGARFHAVDSLRPSWLALYDLDDRLSLLDDDYRKLRAERSPREAELISRLERLERKECTVLYDSGQSAITTSLASSTPTKDVITHSLETDQGHSVGEWKTAVFQQLASVEGWLRTRVFSVDLHPVEVPSKYLVLHELEDSAVMEKPEFEAIVRFHEHSRVTDLRKWNLYRSYPGVAQGNL